MLKAKLRRAGRTIYVFGLSHENLKRLRDGNPIAFDLATLGGTGQVLIMAGATEHAIADELGIEIPTQH